MNKKEFIEELYGREPNLKTEGLEQFDGYFVHWNEIIDACGNGDYNQSPIELITDIADERDELQARIDSLEAEKGMADMGFVSEGAGNEIRRLQANIEELQEQLIKVCSVFHGMDCICEWCNIERERTAPAPQPKKPFNPDDHPVKSGHKIIDNRNLRPGDR